MLIAPDGAPCVSVPLYRRDGTVRAHTLVDAHIFERFATYRWSLGGHGYVSVFIPGVGRQGQGIKGPGNAVAVHRAVLGLEARDPSVSDHISGDKLDNRRANLRVCSQAENLQNKIGYGRYSAHRGVSWDKSRSKWLAYGKAPGKPNKYLGRYELEEDAAAIAQAFRAEHMPFAAR